MANMKKQLNSFTISTFLVLAGCQSNLPQISNDSIKHLGQLISNRGEISEICFDVTKDQVLNFSIKASQPISFNVHYHQDKQSFYPVKSQITRSISQTILIESSSTHCLMWTGQTDATQVEYQYRLLN